MRERMSGGAVSRLPPNRPPTLKRCIKSSSVSKPCFFMASARPVEAPEGTLFPSVITATHASDARSLASRCPLRTILVLGRLAEGGGSTRSQRARLGGSFPATPSAGALPRGGGGS
jgi:hypothetical protein